jgi:protocatechuate 3,4-dioxygenase beta subunit
MMEGYQPTLRTRRQLLQALLVLPTTLTLTSYASLTLSNWTPDAFAQTPVLPPTPACTEPEDATPRQTEGPYYKRSSPERISLLEPGMTGSHLNLTGYVLSPRCQPLARVLLDFWQADAQGQYDNQGYRCRGHQFTDETGRYSLETIMPGLYPGRTRHIHVKVQAPNRPILTTQLYFPGEPRNAHDRIFNPALLMLSQDTANGKAAQFNFVLDIS